MAQEQLKQNPYIWSGEHFFIPKRLAKHAGAKSQQQLRMTKALSREIIRQRPWLYLKWVRESFIVGIGQMARYHWVFWPSLALLVTVPIAWFRGRARGALDLRLLGLLALCGCYTLAHLLLVVLVSWALDRYLAAIALLVPTALCSLLFALWKGMTPAEVRQEAS